MNREIVRKVPSGYLMLVVLLLAQMAAFYGIFRGIVVMSVPGIITMMVVSIVVLIMWAGFFMVHPNQARVLQLFGAWRTDESGSSVAYLAHLGGLAVGGMAGFFARSARSK